MSRAGHVYLLGIGAPAGPTARLRWGMGLEASSARAAYDRIPNLEQPLPWLSELESANES